MTKNMTKGAKMIKSNVKIICDGTTHGTIVKVGDETLKFVTDISININAINDSAIATIKVAYVNLDANINGKNVNIEKAK